ncbi:uncharacterized protein [Rutidosis leptorrhynchoides]|uniref:uncharacterized protein n=1 Tax=Rutidosis leptorrhynchoides TaxID=125765 RepID=UPI003A992162
MVFPNSNFKHASLGVETISRLPAFSFSQERDDNFNKALSPTTLAKSAYEKELMALVLAVQHWRPYLIDADLHALSCPFWLDWSVVDAENNKDPYLSQIITDLKQDAASHQQFSLVQGRLFFKGRLVLSSSSSWIPKLLAEFHSTPISGHSGVYSGVLSSSSSWIPKLLAEFHSTPIAGHSGVYRTYCRLAANLYWTGMVKAVKEFVAACKVCQTVKYEAQRPAGLLSPLPIPSQIWEDISMDFITSLPKSRGFDCIFVVVDRLSKYGHFVALKHPYTVRSVADSFVQDIVRLHGIPRSIVSDRDPVFMSNFWQEIFRSQGTQLRMSSAYHPETDGQTEVVNRTLESYIRCFASEQPRSWSRWLAWAEYWYNTSYHDSAGSTPFQAVYGRPPPTLILFLPGEIRVTAVEANLLDRDEILCQLRFNLQRAQQRMVKTANMKRRDVQFEVGDDVFLKLRQHRQNSAATRVHPKLAARYFGPFRILQRVGTVAYKLELPPSSKIHPVFHVSQLKRMIGNHPVITDLPADLEVSDAVSFEPDRVLAHREIIRNDSPVSQVLVQWVGRPADEAVWLDTSDVADQFPHFHLGDKVVLPAAGNVTESSTKKQDTGLNDKRPGKTLLDYWYLFDSLQTEFSADFSVSGVMQIGLSPSNRSMLLPKWSMIVEFEDQIINFFEDGGDTGRRTKKLLQLNCDECDSLE